MTIFIGLTVFWVGCLIIDITTLFMRLGKHGKSLADHELEFPDLYINPNTPRNRMLRYIIKFYAVIYVVVIGGLGILAFMLDSWPLT